MERRYQRHLHEQHRARERLSDTARRREQVLLEALEGGTAASTHPGRNEQGKDPAVPRFIPFVELYEVPLRDEVRGLLRDAEVRAGVRSGTVSQGVDDELRALTERDVPMADGSSHDSSSTAPIEDRLRDAARRYQRAAEDVLVRRLERLHDTAARPTSMKRR